jgi:hypothetical protein
VPTSGEGSLSASAMSASRALDSVHAARHAARDTRQAFTRQRQQAFAAAPAGARAALARALRSSGHALLSYLSTCLLSYLSTWLMAPLLSLHASSPIAPTTLRQLHSRPRLHYRLLTLCAKGLLQGQSTAHKHTHEREGRTGVNLSKEVVGHAQTRVALAPLGPHAAGRLARASCSVRCVQSTMRRGRSARRPGKRGLAALAYTIAY